MNTQRTASTTDASEQPPSPPDTSTLREYVQRVIEDGELLPGDPESTGAWETAPTSLLDIVGRLGGRAEWLLEFIDAIPSMDLTPPPAPAPAWSVISTDRDQPTRAVVYFNPGSTGGVLGDWWIEEGSLWRHSDDASRMFERIAHVELLHTYSPETQVPVDRALVDEAARRVAWLDGDEGSSSDSRLALTIVRDLAALADGAES